MQKVIAILQTRSYNFADFMMWLKWYSNFIKCDEIYVCDDRSAYDLTQLIELVNPKVHYLKRENIDIKGIPGGNLQVRIYNAILNKIQPNKDDIIIIPDDDEFWWFDKNKYESFKDCVNDYRSKLDNASALFVPWTLMRSKEVMQSRPKSKNFAECFNYRNDIDNCEQKPVMFYNGLINTSFHLGYADGKTITEKTNLWYHSKCKYDLPLRCYHYRFTTVEEYERKKQSDAGTHQPRTNLGKDFLHHFENGIDQNDKYEILDETVKETLNGIDK